MGKKSGLIAVGLVLLATTGCVEAGYPAPSSGYGYAPAYYNNGYYNNGYYNRSYSNSYYSQPGYYRPYGHRYYDYGFWRDRRSDGHG